MSTTTVPAASVHTTKEAHARLRKRYGFEARFKFIGMLAVATAAAALVWLLSSVVGKAVGALTETYITLPVKLDEDVIDPRDTKDPKVIRAGDFSGLIKKSLREDMPFVKKRTDKFALYRLVSEGAALELRQRVMDDPSLIGSTQNVRLLASDDADLYVKGYEGTLTNVTSLGTATPVGTSGDVQVIVESNAFQSVLKLIKDDLLVQAKRARQQARREERGVTTFEGRLKALPAEAGAAAREKIEKQIEIYRHRRDKQISDAEALEKRANTPGGKESLSSDLSSFFVRINGGVVKVNEVTTDTITGTTLIPLQSENPAQSGNWELQKIAESEAGRRVSDKQVTWIEKLRADGNVDTTFNWRFFTASDSREAEQAGIWSSAAGSFWTMLVTFFLAFPIGVAAAIYLEQFAPKNRLTDFIEVNINNLAAVPSIVFGLLGLAVVVEFFGQEIFNSQWRSTALAGGIVLALMSLPTIIIASRAAIKAVPPSIKEAALGVGASNVQSVFHHVLPLAMPGILTGTIIAMAQALGETAPLLMIGMVAFITEVPTSPMDNASVLPVQIFRWSDFPERAFEMRTAAAIMVLLAFLVIMNAIAVLLRKRFERRW